MGFAAHEYRNIEHSGSADSKNIGGVIVSVHPEGIVLILSQLPNDLEVDQAQESGHLVMPSYILKKLVFVAFEQ